MNVLSGTTGLECSSSALLSTAVASTTFLTTPVGARAPLSTAGVRRAQILGAGSETTTLLNGRDADERGDRAALRIFLPFLPRALRRRGPSIASRYSFVTRCRNWGCLVRTWLAKDERRTILFVFQLQLVFSFFLKKKYSPRRTPTTLERLGFVFLLFVPRTRRWIPEGLVTVSALVRFLTRTKKSPNTNLISAPLLLDNVRERDTYWVF